MKKQSFRSLFSHAAPMPFVLGWLMCVALLLTSCSPASPTPTTVAALEQPGLSQEATLCTQEEVLPVISAVEPAQNTPGGLLKVIASGGFFQDSCGGYNESARNFPLYLERKVIGELQCFANHCEGSFTLPEDITPGMHCLSMQDDACQFEFEVIAPTALP